MNPLEHLTGGMVMVTGTLPTEHGWVYGLAGVVSILFGLAAIFWPGLTLSLLVLLFGVFAIVDGIVSIVNVFICIGAKRTWWPSLVLGIIGLVAGFFILAYPGVSAVLYLFVVAFWAIITGVVMVIGSLGTAEFLGVLTGVLAIVLGLILLGNPIVGALAMVMVIGIFAIVRGVMFLVRAFSTPALPNLSP
jgi:uncharacterized membrane protein HdeD (DUF308 family)